MPKTPNQNNNNEKSKPKPQNSHIIFSDRVRIYKTNRNPAKHTLKVKNTPKRTRIPKKVPRTTNIGNFSAVNCSINTSYSSTKKDSKQIKADDHKFRLP